MKRNGYTISELLAVVIILGLLVTIAVTTYSKVIDNSKKSVYKDQEKSLKGATENLLTYCLTMEDRPSQEECNAAGENKPVSCSCYKTNVFIPSYNNTTKISLKDLIDSKFMDEISDPQKGAIYCDDEKSYVEVTNVGELVTNLKYKVCLKCSTYESSDCE